MNYVWLCPKPSEPSGGVGFIHQLAELANNNGLPSYVLQEEAFKPYWLAKPVDPSLLSTTIRKTTKDDVLIIPEVRWPQYLKMNQNKICFMQNHIWLEHLVSDAKVMTCSDYLERYVSDKWGVTSLGAIKPFLEDDVWYADSKRSNHVVLFARRNEQHPYMYQALTRAGYTVSYITGPLTQPEIASLLSAADYYVHLVHPEGWPAACAEAMRSKCVVLGTTGGGGDEFMRHRDTAWVTGDDNIVEKVMAGLVHLTAYPEEKEYIRQRGYEATLPYTKESTLEALKSVLHD